jgi:hypothetical protein
MYHTLVDTYRPRLARTLVVVHNENVVILVGCAVRDSLGNSLQWILRELAIEAVGVIGVRTVAVHEKHGTFRIHRGEVLCEATYSQVFRAILPHGVSNIQSSHNQIPLIIIKKQRITGIAFSQTMKRDEEL